jgi:DinB superfamily
MSDSDSPATPYTADLGGRDPAAAVRESIERIAALTRGWNPGTYERSYAPGKWSAREILIHLAQSELALGNRARMALTIRDYAAQSFDQDRWLERDAALTGSDALAAFVALARMNLAMFERTSATDRAVSMTHPQYGVITVDWIYHQLAGHQRHHLEQLEAIGRHAAEP